jgi:hypothetical protein
VIYELVDPSALIIFGAVVNPAIKLAEGEAGGPDWARPTWSKSSTA